MYSQEPWKDSIRSSSFIFNLAERYSLGQGTGQQRNIQRAPRLPGTVALWIYKAANPTWNLDEISQSVVLSVSFARPTVRPRKGAIDVKNHEDTSLWTGALPAEEGIDPLIRLVSPDCVEARSWDGNCI